MENYQTYIEKLIHCLQGIQISEENGEQCGNQEEAFHKLIELFDQTRRLQNRLFFIGNGGSAAIASHMTADFMKNGGMKTYSLYDNSVTTCMGNDYGYEQIFSRPLEFLANEGDLLVAISSSGNSKNIVNAVLVARDKRMQVITLSGFQRENRISRLGKYNVYVPVCHYGMVESIHNLILQQVVDFIMERDGECL